MKPESITETIKVACSNCNLRELCMPIGFNSEDMQKLDDVVATRRRVKQGEQLFSNGEPFKSLFAIRTGFFKHAFQPPMVVNKLRAFKWRVKSLG